MQYGKSGLAIVFGTAMLLVASVMAATTSAESCPTNNELEDVDCTGVSGCGTSQARAVARALLELSGVQCDMCPDDEPCSSVVEFHGELIGANWYTIEVEIGGFKETFHCFTGGHVEGKLAVDCAECD